MISAAALLIGLTGCIVTSFIGYSMNPTLSPYYGLKLHKGLNGEARILRDKWGIPHIQAENIHDLFFAVGYAQAQDRLFQMDIMRHLVQGRLAEVLGDQTLTINPNEGPTTVLAQDKMNRIIGFKYLGEAGAALLKVHKPETYLLMQDYSDGVNAYVADCGNELPLEFKMLKYSPEPWEPKDIVGLGRFVGWMLAANMEVELIRWSFANKFGMNFMRDLMPLYKKPIPEIPTIIPRELVDWRKLKPAHPKSGDDVSEILPAPADKILSLISDLQTQRAYSDFAPVPYASNNWVVGPKLTESGKPILANDPHLANMMPSVFWQQHIQGAGIDAYGVSFPGMPFIVLGHNRHLAWGMTTSRADVQDVYIEKFDDKGEKYLYKDEWIPITKRVETLKVRKGLRGPVQDAGSIEVRLTRHGPIINDFSPLLKDAPPMAMRWVAYDYTVDQDLSRDLMGSATVSEFIDKSYKYENSSVANEADVILACMKGESIDDFKKATAIHALPNQNWVAVDDKGNYGYIAAGRVPIRSKGLGSYPVPGWTGEYEWIGFIPPEELPQVWNPERGYVVTANNEVVDQNDYPYVFTYSVVPGWRALRIEQLIAEKIKTKKLTVQDMAEIQNDVKMVAAQYMTPLLLTALEGLKDKTSPESAGEALLKKWDYMATTDSVAAAIFNQWRMLIPKYVLEDELGKDYFEVYSMESMKAPQMDYMIINGSPYFDNKNTPEVETREDIFRAAYREAISTLEKKFGKDVLQWQWGKMHTISFEHPLGVGPFKKYLNYGPLPHPGGIETVRNAWHGDDFRTKGGPCLRHVTDMADVENGLWVIDGGESGQWKSPHYNDGAKIWYDGKYIKPIMNMSEVINENEGLLKLQPLP